METSHSCAVHNSRFIQTGGNALFVNAANLELAFDHNEFSDMGDSAVCLVGVEQWSTGSSLVFPRNCQVTNSHFYNLGVYGKQVFTINLDLKYAQTINYNFVA